MAYAKLGDYENSAAAFEKLCTYAISDEVKYYDYIKSATARIEQYTSSIDMYTDRGAVPYYNAVNERKTGVLFGLCADGETRKELGHESLVLTYQELGYDLLPYNSGVLKNAKRDGIAVEYALNCPNYGTDIENIKRREGDLRDISKLFEEYSEVPIYLRFAAEFNIWDDMPSPDEFKRAFRYVANYFHQRNHNVAIVWSPNHVSKWGVDLNDYYPGDEYVDWVGMSLYAQRYFMGDKNRDDELQVAFKTGRNSDPVIAVKSIVEEYGDRKPIMISESGCGHSILVNGRVKENTSDFGIRRLKEYLNYLPMVYPEIKVMAYFDHYLDSSNEKNDYRLSSDKEMKKTYVEATKGGVFVQDNFDADVGIAYRKVTDGISVRSVFTISCYAHKYDKEVQSVAYFIDDKYVGMSTEIPYTTYIDATEFSGRRELKAIVKFNDGSTMKTKSTVKIENDSEDIDVYISGKRISFDQEPILYNNRTMVPLRKIFEELGANVTWDNDTQTATGRRGDRTVKVSVGRNKMYVNNTEYILDTPPIVVSDRTLVPARAVAEGMGCEVTWDDYYKTVDIEQREFTWSDWEQDIPGWVNEDLFYIEEREEYRYMDREEVEIPSASHMAGYASNFSREEVEYGDWGDWSRERQSYNSQNTEEDTRTRHEKEMYFYEHYCTGYSDDEKYRYKTSDDFWYDGCTHHVLGWFDYKLPRADDGKSGYFYYVDGEKQRCSNTCFRWFLTDRTGGDYTEYRYRDVRHRYYFWEYSDWSDWDEDYPYDAYRTESRTVYRYKEK